MKVGFEGVKITWTCKPDDYSEGIKFHTSEVHTYTINVLVGMGPLRDLF